MKYLPLKSFITLILFIHFGCQQSTTTPGDNVLNKHLDSTITFVRTSKFIPDEIQYINTYEDTELLEFGQVDSIKIFSDKPVIIVSTAGGRFRWYRFYPGETINVNRSEVAAPPVYTLNEAERTKEIAYSQANSFFPLDRKVSGSAIADWAGAEHAKLTLYYSSNKLNGNFKNEEATNIIYNAAIQNSLDLLTKANLSIKDLQPLVNVLNENKYTYLLSYRILIFNLINAVKSVDKKSSTNNAFEWLSTNLKDDAKNIALFKLVKAEFTANTSVNELAALTKKFTSASSNSAYKNYFLRNIELAKAKSMSANKDVLLNDVNKQTNLKDYLVENRGKVVYLDLWASWCIPCRAEMPYSEKLQQQLKGEDNIKFAYFSFDVNKAAWENAEKELQINPASSFLVVNDFKSGFARKLKLTSIPRYIIFNKHGDIASNDALRPSDPKLKALLLALSKEE